MSKAEDLAEKLYPKKEHVAYGPFPCEEPNMIDANKPYRIGFVEGYQQATKDLELTWEDIDWIVGEAVCRVPEDSGKEQICKEVLKRFKDYKEGKEK